MACSLLTALTPDRQTKFKNSSFHFCTLRSGLWSRQTQQSVPRGASFSTAAVRIATTVRHSESVQRSRRKNWWIFHFSGDILFFKWNYSCRWMRDSRKEDSTLIKVNYPEGNNYGSIDSFQTKNEYSKQRYWDKALKLRIGIFIINVYKNEYLLLKESWALHLIAWSGYHCSLRTDDSWLLETWREDRRLTLPRTL